MGRDDEPGALLEIAIFSNLYETNVVFCQHHSNKLPLNSEPEEISSNDIFEYDFAPYDEGTTADSTIYVLLIGMWLSGYWYVLKEKPATCNAAKELQNMLFEKELGSTPQDMFPYQRQCLEAAFDY